MDEDTPHMHLLFISVVHTIDKQGNKIDKVCCRDFWRGKNSYRNLQNAYFKHIKVMLNRNEKIENKIIKPRDELIQELYQDNISLHKGLSKQTNIVDMATKYEKKHTQMLEDNVNLKKL